MKITKITQQQNNSEKVNIFLDYKFFMGMKKRIVEYLGLKVGMDVDPDKLKEMESTTFKKLYQNTWERAKERTDIVKKFLKDYNTTIQIEDVGFGSDTTEFLNYHPKSKDKSGPDLKVSKFYIEVTGTEKPFGEKLWVRKDKVEYILNNPDKKIFIFVVLGTDIYILDITKELLEGKSVSTEYLKAGFPEYYYKFSIDETVDNKNWLKENL
ncbi:MAG: hypothetical protein ACRC4T_18645 [Cetobacterium sp.]